MLIHVKNVTFAHMKEILSLMFDMKLFSRITYIEINKPKRKDINN